MVLSVGRLGELRDKAYRNTTPVEIFETWEIFPSHQHPSFPPIHYPAEPLRPSLCFLPAAIMATKSTKITKTGDKRKSSAGENKPAKKLSAKKEGPESTRKLWKSQDASDDSSDDDESSDREDEDVAPPSKKVKQARDEADEAKPAKQFEKEKGMWSTGPCAAQTCIISLTMSRRDL